MVSLAALVLLASSYPCQGDTLVLGATSAPEPPVACDAADIPIERACDCVGPRIPERWGKTADLSLVMPRAIDARSGAEVAIPFTLRFHGKDPVSLDFQGGAVVFEQEIRQAGKPVAKPACGMLAYLPPAVRLTLRPGAKVRGAVKWRASNYQGEGCQNGAHALAPGRYAVTFSTKQGEPPLEATVQVTVK